MRPYKLRMRLSSRRLNVTRLCWGPAAAERAAARFSLGSASSDIELMKRLLSSKVKDCANRRRLQEALCRYRRRRDRLSIVPTFEDPETLGHGIVSGIILLPHFRPSTAPLPCEKKTLRWPGPFGSGFLSPQPPGAVGIGPVRRGANPHTGPTKVGPFSFWGSSFPGARSASQDVQLHIRDSLTTLMTMDSGPAPPGSAVADLVFMHA